MIFDRRKWLMVTAGIAVKLLGPPTVNIPIESEEESSLSQIELWAVPTKWMTPRECDIRYHPSIERYATAVWKAGV